MTGQQLLMFPEKPVPGTILGKLSKGSRAVFSQTLDSQDDQILMPSFRYVFAVLIGVYFFGGKAVPMLLIGPLMLDIGCTSSN